MPRVNEPTVNAAKGQRKNSHLAPGMCSSSVTVVNIFYSLYLADNIAVTLFKQLETVLWTGAHMPWNALTHELFLLIMLHHVTTSV